VGCGGKGGDQIYRRPVVEGGEGEEERGGRQESSGRSGETKGMEGVRFGWLPLLFISISERVVESKMNGQDELGYLGRHGLLCLSFFFFFFPFYCTIVKFHLKRIILYAQIYFLYMKVCI
jgi:hypothetical protein